MERSLAGISRTEAWPSALPQLWYSSYVVLLGAGPSPTEAHSRGSGLPGRLTSLQVGWVPQGAEGLWIPLQAAWFLAVSRRTGPPWQKGRVAAPGSTTPAWRLFQVLAGVGVATPRREGNWYL